MTKNFRLENFVRFWRCLPYVTDCGICGDKCEMDTPGVKGSAYCERCEREFGYWDSDPVCRFHERWNAKRQRIRYLLAFLTVWPRRRLFRKLCCAPHRWEEIRWLPARNDEWDIFDEWAGQESPWWRNIHWPDPHLFVLDRTLFRFCRWLENDAWRPLAKWSEPNSRGMRHRVGMPWTARLVKRIGQTTTGAVIHGGECWHCASPAGDPYELQQDESGTTFVDVETWTSPSMEGTDHRFKGITICPCCGYRDQYEDGSL